MSTKDLYVEKHQAEIDKWNTEIEHLEAKIIEASADAGVRREHEQQINILRQHRDEAKAKLAEIQAVHEDRWEDIKDGMEGVWTSIKDGFEKVKAKFTESNADRAHDNIVNARERTHDNIVNAKKRYIEKHQAQIDTWNVELDAMDARIAAAGVDANARLEHETHVRALRQKRDDAKAKLAEIQAAGDDTWEDLKDGMESVWTSVKEGFEKVKAKF